jgi:four helix bundle protein
MKKSPKIEEFHRRSIDFAVGVMQLVKPLRSDDEHGDLLAQLVRSCTSLGAKFANASASLDLKRFRQMMCLVELWAAEAVCWLDIFAARGVVPADQIAPLQQEAREVLEIVSRSIRSARKRK